MQHEVKWTEEICLVAMNHPKNIHNTQSPEFPGKLNDQMCLPVVYSSSLVMLQKRPLKRLPGTNSLGFPLYSAQSGSHHIPGRDATFQQILHPWQLSPPNSVLFLRSNKIYWLIGRLSLKRMAFFKTDSCRLIYELVLIWSSHNFWKDGQMLLRDFWICMI